MLYNAPMKIGPKEAQRRAMREPKLAKAPALLMKAKAPVVLAAQASWSASLYAPPSECSFCDARREHSKLAMRKIRAKKGV